MIGVAVNSTDLGMAEEFFELFKTPWERAVPGRKYRVVLSADGRVANFNADLILVYSAGELAIDREAGIAVKRIESRAESEWSGSKLPLYCGVATFDAALSAREMSCRGRAVSYQLRNGSRVVQRIGYDLFAEVRSLLTDGQPVAHATSPTLELHIAVLRHLLLESGIPFVEVPPRPLGYEFICCLTHDVDFFGIRRHKFDRTLAGFVARASVGTLVDLVRGRRSFADAVRNWTTLVTLPLVFLGLAPDFWQPFEDYAAAEDGRRSTFFLVPFKGRPGVAPDQAVDAARAVPYQVSEIEDELKRAAAHASEFGVHGIDAWRDENSGRAEMEQLTTLTGAETAGVRMHWLYFDDESPRRLEAAGFDYDSTWGYNETVGYRAGTSQVFRLPASERLMELPLSIMDSALFFRGRMHLGDAEASRRCGQIVANARRFGGTVVINWHDRSLVPERLWGRFYRHLLDEVGQGDRAWFATGRQAVDWFRWRRSIRFTATADTRGLSVTASPPPASLPAALLQVHHPVNGSTASAQALHFDGLHAMELAL